MENNKFFSNNFALKMFFGNIAFRLSLFSIIAVFSSSTTLIAGDPPLGEITVHASGIVDCSFCAGSSSASIFYLPSSNYSYGSMDLPQSAANMMAGNWVTTTSGVYQQLQNAIPQQNQRVDQLKLRKLLADTSVVAQEIANHSNDPMGGVSVSAKAQAGTGNNGVAFVLGKDAYNTPTYVSVNIDNATGEETVTAGVRKFINGNGDLIYTFHGPLDIGAIFPIGRYTSFVQDAANVKNYDMMANFLQPNYRVTINDFSVYGVHFDKLNFDIDASANTFIAGVKKGAVTAKSNLTLNKWGTVVPGQVQFEANLPDGAFGPLFPVKDAKVTGYFNGDATGTEGAVGVKIEMKYWHF